MTDTTLTRTWAFSREDTVEAQMPSPRRGFAVGLVVAIPIAVLAWYLIFSLV